MSHRLFTVTELNPENHLQPSQGAHTEHTTMSSNNDISGASSDQKTVGKTMVQKGLLAGLACYAIWGTMPLFFASMAPASPVEIIAHRIVWSLLLCVILLTVMKRWNKLMTAIKNFNVVRTLSIATVLILCNWLTYVYSVSSNHVLDASLGYYINPLVTVILAVVVLRERVDPMMWVALGFGAAAVVVMTAGMGSFPWISIVLAFSFGFYGLMKSRIGSKVDSITSLTIETLLAAPFALGFLAWLTMNGQSTFTSEGTSHALLLMITGVITAVPLIFFGFAAQHLPLSYLGMLQYLGPTIQFLLAIAVFHEPMPTARWVGFGLVWVAIIFAILSATRQSRSVSSK